MMPTRSERQPAPETPVAGTKVLETFREEFEVGDRLGSAWVLFRCMVIGMYVGLATVGVFIIWYTHGSFLGIDLSGDGHSLVTYSQLANWGQCSSWTNFTASPFTAGNEVLSFDNPCDYFHAGKVKAMTLSLSVGCKELAPMMRKERKEFA